jgi:hypothetical protein
VDRERRWEIVSSTVVGRAFQARLGGAERAALLCVLLVANIVSLAGDTSRRGTNITSGCLDRFDPAADYFSDKLAIEDAANFSVEDRKSYKVVTIEAYASAPPERYVGRRTAG